MSTTQALARLGAVAAIVGAVVFFVAGLLHPASADPNDLPAAFAEYAASPDWVGIHLGQFAGLALAVIGLVALAATLEPGRAAAWAQIGLAGAVAALAVYATLQAVDGVSNYVMVHRWASASGESRVLVYEAAFAVRQIEVGLTSLFSLLLGSTLVVFSIAMLLSTRYPTWLGGIGVLGGLGMVAAGLEQAYNGFSAVALNVSMVASFVALIWIIVTGFLMWRLAAQLAGDGDMG